MPLLENFKARENNAKTFLPDTIKILGSWSLTLLFALLISATSFSIQEIKSGKKRKKKTLREL